MAFPNAHLLLRAMGNFGPSVATNQEKWSAGLRFGVIGADVNYNATALQVFAEAAHAAFVAFHPGTAVGAGTTCFFTGVSVARVGPDGKYLPTQQETTYSTGLPIAGSPTTVHPWSTANVLSLRTANFRGYASNGRFYYPATGAAIDANTGRISGTNVTNRLNLVKTLFDALNTAAQAYAVNMRVIVASSTGNTAAKVTSVRQDERLDAIERRENAAPAVWKSVTLVP